MKTDLFRDIQNLVSIGEYLIVQIHSKCGDFSTTKKHVVYKPQYIPMIPYYHGILYIQGERVSSGTVFPFMFEKALNDIYKSDNWSSALLKGTVSSSSDFLLSWKFTDVCKVIKLLKSFRKHLLSLMKKIASEVENHHAGRDKANSLYLALQQYEQETSALMT